jgi:RNA polymerase sigma factor (sigma-70 family)
MNMAELAFRDAPPSAKSPHIAGAQGGIKLTSVSEVGTKKTKKKRKKLPDGGLGGPAQHRYEYYGPRRVFSLAEEAQYAKAYEAGDVEAGNLLALSVAPLVVSIVRKWKVPPGVEIDDLIQEAHLAVLLALKRGTFNPSKGRRLSTWVYRQVVWSCLRVIDQTQRHPMESLPEPDLVTDHRPEFTEEVDRREEQERRLRAVFACCEKLGPRHAAVLMARTRGLTFAQIGQDPKIFRRPVGEERVRQIESQAIDFIWQSFRADNGVDSPK